SRFLRRVPQCSSVRRRIGSSLSAQLPLAPERMRQRPHLQPTQCALRLPCPAQPLSSIEQGKSCRTLPRLSVRVRTEDQSFMPLCLLPILRDVFEACERFDGRLVVSQRNLSIRQL